MAKRFTDTEKWKRPWFSELSTAAKLVWIYVLDDCDHCGVWAANFKRLSFDLGAEITREQFESWFGAKAVPLDADKYFIPSFIEFQYGKLSPTNKAHQRVISFVERLGPSYFPLKVAPCKPLGSPSQGAKDKDKDKESSSSLGEKTKYSVSPDLLAPCIEAWADTLKHFGVDRPLGAHDQTQLARAIQQFGADDVLLALRGSRFESATESFRPKDHLSLERIFGRDRQGNFRIGKFINLAGQNKPADRRTFRPKEGAC